MKEYYKIGEISNLYDIGPDSLRYYEKIGILNPKRDTNGYRVYSIRDIWKLNVIRDLRKLNFSMERIKSYLNERTLTSTKGLLEEELGLINDKISSLLSLKENINNRIDTLNEGIYCKELEEVKVRYVKSRKVLTIEENVSRDEEVDFLLKKLNKDHEDKLYLLGNSSMGTIIPMEYIEKSIYNRYNSVFIELDEKEAIYDFVLDEGDYAYVAYRGDYNKNQVLIPKILEFIKGNKYKIDSNFIEICKIDIHETSVVNEFLTELQVKVKK